MFNNLGHRQMLRGASLNVLLAYVRFQSKRASLETAASGRKTPLSWLLSDCPFKVVPDQPGVTTQPLVLATLCDPSSPSPLRNARKLGKSPRRVYQVFICELCFRIGDGCLQTLAPEAR